MKMVTLLTFLTSKRGFKMRIKRLFRFRGIRFYEAEKDGKVFTLRIERKDRDKVSEKAQEIIDEKMRKSE